MSLVLPLLASRVAFAHADSPASPPLRPEPLVLRHRSASEIVSLFRSERLADGDGSHVPRAARPDEPGSLVPFGVEALLRTRDPHEVVIVGTEGSESVRECIRMLDVPEEDTPGGRKCMSLTLRHADPRQLQSRVLHLPGTGSVVISGRVLHLEGSPEWLHRAERQAIRAELHEPATFGM